MGGCGRLPQGSPSARLRAMLIWLPICGQRRKPNSPPARPCPHCEIPRRRFARVHHARLPVDARGASLSSYEWDSEAQQRAIQSAQAWLLSPRADRAPNVYLFGPPGNGKTTLLYGLAFAALDRGLKVRYATHARLFDDEKDSWRGETESPFRTWLDDVDLLLLDELGGLGGGGIGLRGLKSAVGKCFKRFMRSGTLGSSRSSSAPTWRPSEQRRCLTLLPPPLAWR